MRDQTLKIVTLVMFVILGWSTSLADSYATFETKRFYSANNVYFVEVTPNKLATFYRQTPRRKKLWSRALPELPAHLFITDDGARVVMVDFYYGNKGSESANVVLVFDEAGNQIAGHALNVVANLSRVTVTTSSAHWYYGAFFTPDQNTFIVETVATKCVPPEVIAHTPEDRAVVKDCMKTTRFEALEFSVATGSLISRTDIHAKYVEQEKRLLHELELVENEHPPNSDLVYFLLELAHYYQEHRDFIRAKEFYDRAIPIYSKALGLNFVSVAQAVGDAATNTRELGNYAEAENLYQRALTSLDKTQGDPGIVSPRAIKVYEDYAILLRLLNRVEEARKLEQRASVLRLNYPTYKD